MANRKVISRTVLTTTPAIDISDVIRQGDSDAYELRLVYADQETLSGMCNLHFVLPDGTVADRDASDGVVVVAGNEIRYLLEPALYAQDGVLECYVQFLDSNLYTPLLVRFIGVHPVPGGVEVELTQPYPQWYENAISAETGRASAEIAREDAEGLRASAETERDGAEGLRKSSETAREEAEGLRQSAETLREDAESLRASAEIAREDAEGLRASAETERQISAQAAVDACEAAVARVDASLLAVNKRYGLYWDGSLTASATRLGDAVGMTFAPWVGATAAVNSFEAVRPWSDCVRCNLADDGTVNAFEGEPGFVPDGSNGQVMVRIPKFYYRVIMIGDAREWWVAPDPLPEFSVHPAFVVGGVEKDEIYISAYMGAEEASKLVSKTGVVPQYNKTRSQFRTLARARGAGWGICDFTSYSALQLLLLVMMGNLNAQTTVGRGICDMPYTSSHTAQVSEPSVNRIIVTNAVAALYQTGWQIGIGTSLGGNQIALQRTITGITVYDAGNMAVEFDGAAVNIAAGNILYSVPQKTGWADTVGGHTGRGAGTDGKTEVCVLGVQGFWGNWWQFVDGANMDSGYYMWVCDDSASYVDDTFISPYVRIESVLPSASDGYLRTFSDDPDAPWAMLPKSIGGDNANPVGDYYYRNATPANRVLFLGGDWIGGSTVGPWYWYVSYTSANAYWHFGARLLFKPG